MDDRLSRLRQWLTPNYLHRALVMPERALLKPGWRLYVLRIDATTKLLVDPQSRALAFEQLRTRLFPQLLVRMDFTDISDLTQDGRQLWLTEAAAVRWRNAAPNTASNLGFSYQFLPFAIALDGECLAGGWVVPAESRARLGTPGMRLLVGTSRLALEFIAAGDDDPAKSIASCRLR